MVFSHYVTPLDREYGKSTLDDAGTSDVGIGIKDIGMSVPMGISALNVQDVSAKLKSGARIVEIGFPGAFVGGRGRATPGLYGVEQREALRELAAINEVDVTTHASYNIIGLAGLHPETGQFSETFRKQAVDEINRAIEFAADVTKGGPVVVHAGEFPRPLSEQPWATSLEGKPLFRRFKEEEKMAPLQVVDVKKGRILGAISKDEKIARPVWLTAERDYRYVAEEDDPELGIKKGDIVYVSKGDFVDYEGRKVSLKRRVPVFDPKTGRFKVRMTSWDDFVKEAELMNAEKARRLGIPLWQLPPEERIKPEEAFYRGQLETSEAHAKGWALYYAQGFEKAKKRLEQLKNSYKVFKKIYDETPPEKRKYLIREYGDELSRLGLIPVEYKYPHEIIEEEIKNMRRQMEYASEASTSQQAQAMDSLELQNRIQSIDKYALKESFKSYAEAGIRAFELTKQKKLRRPLFIAMEHISPESYGGHPEELRTLVRGARKKMAEMLIERGYSKKAAEEAAKKHIKITLDTGHLNLWRRYWVEDPKKSFKENEDAFKKWAVQQVEKLAKEDMIGHVHLADNYGYADEHLTPGQGTAPIREIIDVLRKHGYEGPLIAEPGAEATVGMGDVYGLMKTWDLFGSPVYAAHVPARADVPKPTWTDIQYSYFGQTRAPYYVFGPYRPSEDWTLWSGVPLE